MRQKIYWIRGASVRVVAHKNEILLANSWHTHGVANHAFPTGRGWAMGYGDSFQPFHERRFLGKTSRLLLLPECLRCRAVRVFARGKLVGVRFVVAFSF